MMNNINEDHELILSELKATANLFDMNVAALLNPEDGGGQISEEVRIAAMQNQIKAYDSKIYELGEIFKNLREFKT